VQLTRFPLDGVPSTGATIVGELRVLLLIVAPLIVAPTASAKLPEPVTEVVNADKTPVPYPVTFPTGRPVQLTKLPELGVPKVGDMSVGELKVLLFIVA